MSATASPTPAPLTAATLTGVQKSALLCLSLGEAEAARLLQSLTPDQVERITRAIATLPAVGPEVVEAVLREYAAATRAAESTTRGGSDVARSMLETALGAGRARPILDRLEPAAPPAEFQRLRAADPATLATALAGENPQIVAALLAHLEPSLSARVVSALDPGFGGEVLERMATLGPVPPAVVARMSAELGARIDVPTGADAPSAGGPAAVARLINLCSEPHDANLLARLRERDEALAIRVNALRFTFEDLVRLDARSTQRVLREVETRELALALKAASPEISAHIARNMSERASEALEEEIELLGAVRIKDVEAAREGVLEIVRRLEADQEITIQREGKSDDLVA